MQADERWATIDRELDALGKDEAELAAVIARARALVAGLDVEAELLALGAPAEPTPVQAPAERPSTTASSTAARPAPVAPPRGTIPSRSTRRAEPSAPRAQPSADATDSTPRSAPQTSPPSARPPSAAPAALGPRTDLPPPPLELEIDDLAPPIAPPRRASTAPAAQRASSPAPAPPPSTSGLSVDELFADADLAPPPTEGLSDLFETSAPIESAEPGSLAELFEDAPVSSAEVDLGGLADLLDDPSLASEAPPAEVAELEGEEIRLSDPELDLLEDLAEPAPERPRTMPPPLPAQRPPVPAIPASALPPASGGELELFVDEAVLELEDEPERPPPDEPKGGLISRLLRRKP